MSKLNKFEDVDVFASLDAIMKQNTGFYQSDFDIDREIIAKTAASASKEDKTLLWFCRPSGTHCFRERDVFLKDTAPIIPGVLHGADKRPYSCLCNRADRQGAWKIKAICMT